MSTVRLFLCLSLGALSLAMVFAMPRPGPRTVELDHALNRTVCPITVEVDEDPNRVPRRIKMMKCAPQPNRWCIEQHIPQHECCEHSHNNHVMACVELHDTVLVYYNSTGTTTTYDVAVGCACLIEGGSDANGIPSLHTMRHSRDSAT